MMTSEEVCLKSVPLCWFFFVFQSIDCYSFVKKKIVYQNIRCARSIFYSLFFQSCYKKREKKDVMKNLQLRSGGFAVSAGSGSGSEALYTRSSKSKALQQVELNLNEDASCILNLLSLLIIRPLLEYI